MNDKRPMFTECSNYSPKVMEGAPNGTPVVKVHATDEDKGVNGQVKYSIVRQPNQKGVKFTVNEETGEVFTNKVKLLNEASLCTCVFFKLCFCKT